MESTPPSTVKLKFRKLEKVKFIFLIKNIM